MSRRRDPQATPVVHRSARISLRPTSGQRRRLFGLLAAAGDVWACVLEANWWRRYRHAPPLAGYQELCRDLAAAGPGTFGDPHRWPLAQGDVHARPDAVPRRLHRHCFQANNLLSFLTARENVEVMASISHKSGVRHRANDLLTQLGLDHRADALATELSGGERQRVAIARALANQPDVILVDEPTANLDTERGEQVIRALAEQTHTNDIIGIMVTHDQRMVAYADQVLEIRDGRHMVRPPS